jgi:hypothetical protein
MKLSRLCILKNIEAPVCACGLCDKLVTWNKNKKCWNEFSRGHYKDRHGKKPSQESNIKRSKTQTGRKDPEKVKNNKKAAGYLFWQNIPEENKTIRIEKAKESLIIASENNKGKHHSKKTKQKISESNKGKHDHFKEKNPNWKNGISFLPYPPQWTSQLKKKILKRDNYICQNPNCSKSSQKISVHHIDYKKHNCSEYNLIALCLACNSKANHKRDYWEQFYMKIIKEKYDAILSSACA